MESIIIHINRNSSIPIYQQLYEYIRKEIICQRFASGSKLPSIRTLASQLKISKITVNNAYQQLISEGYIVSKNRSGMYVAEIDNIINIKPILGDVSSEDSYKSNFHDIKKLDFKYGNIDTSSFPFSIIRKLSSQVLNESNNYLLQNGPVQGELSLRSELSKYLRASRGVLCDPSQIIITSGTKNSLSIICNLLSGKIQNVAMEDPGWLRARQVFIDNNLVIRSIKLNNHGICVKELMDSNSQMVYVTPAHQFPTGKTMPISRRQQLLQWAVDNNSLIIEDDYDSEFKYEGRPIPALQGLDTNNRVIYLGSFSKVFSPAIHISYMVLPKNILEIYRSNQYRYKQTASRISQQTLSLFMLKDHWNRHIRKMRRIYSKKNRIITSAVDSYLAGSCKLIGGNSGMHVLLEILNGMKEEYIISEAKARGIMVYPTSKYSRKYKASTNPTILLGFGGLSEQEIIEGIRILSTIISK